MMTNTLRETVNVAAYLTRMAEKRPYQRAVVVSAGRQANGYPAAYAHLTFRQLERETDCLAYGLDEMGIGRGMRTILMVQPSLEFFVIIFTLFKIGAVPVVVDPGMGIRRMMSCLAESKAAALIGIPAAHLLKTFYPGFFKTVKHHVTVGRRWFWRGKSLAQLRKTPWQTFPVTDTQADETAAILFTTGSTGPAKGAVYTHGIFDAQVRHIQSKFQIQPGEIDLPTFPLFALFDPALGMTAVVPNMDPTKPAQVNPHNIIGPILHHGVTNMFASPALLNRVGRYGAKKNIQLPTLKRVISAGAPALPQNLERFSRMLNKEAQIFPGYGATEAMPVAVMGSHEILSETRKLSEQGFGICVGRAFDGLKVKIIRISDNAIEHWSGDLELPSGEIGEIVVQGDVVTRRYFDRIRDDMMSKITEHDTFWHRMGDLGWMDKDGRLWFCGRKSHRVITSRGTLYTVPCEAIFNNHPSVFRSALVGIGPKPEQQPVICIELENPAGKKQRAKIETELHALATSSVITQSIRRILFHRSFPVDIRHNSKIFREKLAVWAEKKIAVASNRKARFRKSEKAV
ncbi:MAG: fatty acid CoA ligase family protein [Deltaproteobacteria bacterium]